MCRLRNIAMRDYQESVTIGQTHTDGQIDAGQSDPYMPVQHKNKAFDQNVNI